MAHFPSLSCAKADEDFNEDFTMENNEDDKRDIGIATSFGWESSSVSPVAFLPPFGGHIEDSEVAWISPNSTFEDGSGQNLPELEGFMDLPVSLPVLNETKLAEREFVKGGAHRRRKNKKKPVGAPKRPLSAYNYYFQEERVRLMQKKGGSGEPSLLPGGKKIGFQELARTIGKKWRTLNEAEKQRLHELSSKDHYRYDQDMTAWKKKRNEKERHRERAFTKVKSVFADDSTTKRIKVAQLKEDIRVHEPEEPSISSDGLQGLPPNAVLASPGTEIFMTDENGVQQKYTIGYKCCLVSREEAVKYVKEFEDDPSLHQVPLPELETGAWLSSSR